MYVGENDFPRTNHIKYVLAAGQLLLSTTVSRLAAGCLRRATDLIGAKLAGDQSSTLRVQSPSQSPGAMSHHSSNEAESPPLTLGGREIDLSWPG